MIVTLRPRLLLAAIAVALPCSLAFGQAASAPPVSTPTAKGAGSAALSAADRKFADQAAMAGAAEIAAGGVAQQKAGNAAVKRFGTHMVEDHTKAAAELKQIADAKGLTIPNAPDAAHQSELQQLEKLSGAQFDREFMKGMVRDHEKAVALFDKQAKSGKDAQLKAYASKTLPTLQNHLQRARQVQTEVGGKQASR